jgi:transglutaminase-like putative cysteine protease
MRTRFWLHFALVLSSLLAPVSVLAQFQPPTKEELSMKSEPKAPGADAIYLYREETTDDNLHYHSFLARIKVLTEKGKELATQSIPYYRTDYKITDIKARTIHSDGTIIPLDVKPADLVEQKGAGFQVNKIVFTLPSVEVGSILEYRWQLRYEDNIVSSPYWDIMQLYYVRKAHYSFVPAKSLYYISDNKGKSANRLLYSMILPNDAKIVTDATGKYSLDVVNVLPIPKEEYMPPLGSLIAQVKFFYTWATTQEDFWKVSGNEWSKEMDRFANETKTIKDAAATIIASGDSDEQKAHKIYDAVMALDNTDYTRRKSKEELKAMGLKQTKQAEDVWRQKSGSSDEIALLYLALVRAAGLKASAVLVCNRDREVFSPYYLSMGQFDDVVVDLTINGKDQFLDPGKKFAPYGMLDWKHSYTGSMRQQDKSAAMMVTPSNTYKEAVTTRVGVLDLDKDGNISGTVRISMVGPSATRWRELAIENDEDEVKKRFDEELKNLVPDGVVADFDHFLGLEDYKSSLMGIVKISGNLGNVTGKRVILPGLFFESRAKHPFVAEETRLTTVDMAYAETVHDVVTYRLPSTYSIEGAAPEASVQFPSHAVLQIKSTPENNGVTIDRTMARAFSMLKPQEYTGLRDFYQKVATADQQQLILVASPATHGN